MTRFTYGKQVIPTTDLNGESSLPPIAGMKNVQQQTKTELDEDDELYVGYGFVNSSFPYRLQDCYSRGLEKREVRTVVLENEYLRATFLPDWGGRLWSLYDLKADRELTFANPVIRPCNLAIRNAWLSGGVEWNCGMVGHHPFTCSPLFTAKLKLKDGTPVLRFYEFERVRGAVFQMDFFLPEGSPLLYARMRIVNPNSETVPMYWWSNIAVPEDKGSRVIIDTDETFTNRDNMISKIGVPINNGVDITYPVNNAHAIDFFWKLNPDSRRFVAQLDSQGYGLVQTSTRRLKGRKLFVWGQGPGGDRWQEFLTEDGTGGRYAEIQAGLAHTQYECLPMPPKTAWEWLEGYGALQADPAKIHGEWGEARREALSNLDGLVKAETLEELLISTGDMAKSKAEEILIEGSGWGALERKRRSAAGENDMAFCGHLDFGSTKEEQKPWEALLRDGFTPGMNPSDVPASWMLQKEWTAVLEGAVEGGDRYNWYTWLQLGMTYFALSRIDESESALSRSMELEPSCWAMYGLAQVAKYRNQDSKAGELALKAASMKPEDVSLVKECLKLLDGAHMDVKTLSLGESLPENVRGLGRVRLYLAIAHLRQGQLDKAEELLFAADGLDGDGKPVLTIPDIREGEVSVTELWYQLEEAKAKRAGTVFDRESAVPPAALDFRMSATKK